MVKSSRRSLNDEWGHPGRSKLPTRNALWKTFRGNCAAQSSQRISNFRFLTLSSVLSPGMHFLLARYITNFARESPVFQQVTSL